MTTLAIVSGLSIYPAFAYARQVKITKQNFFLILYIGIAGAFQLIDLALYLNKIDRFWLYHIYTPIEMPLLSVIILALYELSGEEIKKYIKISSGVALIAVIFDIIFNNVNELDKMLMTFQCVFILFVIGSIFWTHKDIDFNLRNYRTYVLSGIAIYHFMNVVTYPEYHMESNIILNTFLLIALLRS